MSHLATLLDGSTPLVTVKVIGTQEGERCICIRQDTHWLFADEARQLAQMLNDAADVAQPGLPMTREQESIEAGRRG